MALWSRVAVTDAGCWEWQGHRNEHGYGRLLVRGLVGELGELIAQTRLDEALACERVIAPALADHRNVGVIAPALRLDARIADHRRDLRAARRAKKET